MATKFYSGKFVIRVGAVTHKKISLIARNRDISLNEAVKLLLDAGFKNIEKNNEKVLVN